MAKKLVLLVLGAAFALTLFGCDGPTSTATDQAKKSEQLKKIADESPNSNKVE